MFGHPKIPTVVRAPLSQAQLQRFTQGPVYGQRPLDSHELLKSPRLALAGGADVDSMDIVPPESLASIPEDTRGIYGHTPRASVSSASAFPQRNATLARPQAQQPGFVNNDSHNPLCNQQPVFGDAFTQPARTIDYSNVDLANGHIPKSSTSANPVVFSSNSSNGGFPNNTVSAPSNQMRVPSIDSNFDPAMDTSADLDWESWDQLVRQFGMDVDGGDKIEGLDNNTWDFMGNGQAPATGQQNYRMGPGVNGGDWF
jgi:hypothetical protein